MFNYFPYEFIVHSESLGFSNDQQINENKTINKIKNALEGINNRITEAEERVSDPEIK